MAGSRLFDRGMVIEALGELGRRAYAEGKTIEVSIYRGSALMLTYDWRQATRYVDAVFEADRTVVRRLAGQIAEERGWDADWLNDGVKGFLSEADRLTKAKRTLGTFPSEDEPGIRIMVAAPEYLFAMKCRAMRIGGVDGNSDIGDIRGLAAEIGIGTAESALDLVSRFYPHQILEPKVRFGLQGIFDGFLPDPDAASTEEQENGGDRTP